MPGPFTARPRPSSLLSHDWLAEVPSRVATEIAAAGGSHNAPSDQYTPPSVNRSAHARTNRLILLMMSAMALMRCSRHRDRRVMDAPRARARAAGRVARLSAADRATDAPAAPSPHRRRTGARTAAHARARTRTRAGRCGPDHSGSGHARADCASRGQDTVAGRGSGESGHVRRSEESAILSVLDRYRLAFSSLNPGSVRAVAFDTCRIDVKGAQADAVCAGRVSLATTAGSQGRNIQSRRWIFTLVHGRDAWRIQTAQIDR